MYRSYISTMLLQAVDYLSCMTIQHPCVSQPGWNDFPYSEQSIKL